MLIDTNSTIRKISAELTEVELALAKAYIQGAVHSHCNNCADKELSARILFGGNNRNWADTPLQCIYDYHKKSGSEQPGKNAAQDVGWLLKSVLAKDKRRTFEHVGNDTGNIYKLKLETDS